MKKYFLAILTFLTSCSAADQQLQSAKLPDYQQLFDKNPEFKANGFDFPVGKPNGQGYYNAQKFRQNNHLGEDWNGNGGGDTDLGDSIYAIGNGYVHYAAYAGPGWGNVICVLHQLTDSTYVESLYGHCKELLVQPKQFVKKGQQIATIGNADGAYLAHLHLELRDRLGLPVGGGYSTNAEGYLDPTQFIRQHREF